jgi:hypothetical protein
MPKPSWQEHLDPLHFIVFDYLQEQFFSNSIEWDSLFLYPVYKSYLSMPLSQTAKRNLNKPSNILKALISKKEKDLNRKREKIDTLFKLLQEWVNEEFHMASGSIFSGKGILGHLARSRFVKLDKPKRLALTMSFQNILCLVTWEHTISELVELACYGSDKSTFRLIQLNKRFLDAKWIQDRVALAQRYNDKAFFNKLGNCIKKDTPDKTYAKAEIGFKILLLWFLGFKDLTNPEFLSYLQEEKIVSSTLSQPSFNVLVNRLGLRKYRKT